MVELALQGLLVVLLLLTITWCVIVHYRLRRLRTDRGELEAFIAALGEATGRAEDAVRQMREANQAVESTARDQERRARQQSAELARLMDNAVRVVKRLDAAVEQGATRLAELRTPMGATGAPRSTPPEVAAPRPTRPVRLPPGEPLAADIRAPASPTGPAGIDAPRRAPPIRPVRREGQLDGLLHGELLEALQGLR
jgi:hypothetical protein